MDSKFELNFEKFLRKLFFKKHGLDLKDKRNDNVPNPPITSRTLFVQMCSPWGDLLNKEESITLGSLKGQIFRANGSLPLDNYIEHPLIGLNFRIVYSANLKRQGARDEFVEYTVGYESILPVMDGKFKINNQPLNVFCKGGPGYVGGNLVWSSGEV